LKAALIGGVLCAAPVPVLAAPPLAWAQCVELATRHNPELRAARENLRAAEHQAQGAYSGYLPQLSGSAGVTDSGVAGADTTQYSAALSASQNLFAGFRDESTVAQAAANRTATVESLNLVRARVSFDLKSAYAQLRFAQDNLLLAQDIARRREENQRLVQLRFEGGRENKGSYFLSRAALGEARLEQLQAEHAVEVARVQLARVLGVDAQDWEPADRVPLQRPESDVNIERLLPNTPEVRQALAQENAAQAGIGIARAGLLPSLNLSGSVGRQGEEWVPGDNTRSMGLTLSVPIYSGGRDYHATQSATAGFAAAQASRENVERQARTRLKQAYRNYQQAVEKLRVDEDFVEAAALRAEIARSKYNNGLLSFEDWDLIENDLINRQKALLVSVRERVTAEAGWEQAKGEGVIP
jgi:outer membrane protein TolC